MSLSTTQRIVKYCRDFLQVSPYLSTSQPANPGPARASQTMLPNISQSHSGTSQSQSSKNTAPTTTATTSASASKSVTTVTIGSKTAPSAIRHSVSMSDVPKPAGDDVKLKMTHANSASSIRRSRDKPDRGN